MATRTMTAASHGHSGHAEHALGSRHPSGHGQTRRPHHHRQNSNTSSTSTATTTATKTSRPRSRDRSHANLTALHTLDSSTASSPEDMPQVARIGPKRKSKVGISAMHPAGAGDGLKRAKHERNKGSTASLASLGGGTTTSSEAARSRKASGRDRARLAVQEPAEDDWVSASGGESASQTPNTSGPSSPLPRAPPIERQQSQNYGVTPTARDMPSVMPELSATPKQTISAPASPPRSRQVDNAAEAPTAALPPAADPDAISNIPFPSTSAPPPAPESAPTSPVRAAALPRQTRKPSTASIASRMSVRSLRQPLSPSVALAPQLATTQGQGTVSVATSLGRSQSTVTPAEGRHSRALSGTQSLDHSALARKLREASGTRGRHVSSESSRSFANLTRLSDTFGGLRGLLTGSAAPSPTTASPPNRQSRVPPYAQQPRRTSTLFVSKFISPSDLSPPVETAAYTSMLPEYPMSRSPPTSSPSSSNLQRTQQRLLQQRDQPFLPESRISPPDGSLGYGHAGLLPPMSASTSPTDVAALNLPTRQLQCLQAQRQWAKTVVREAERVDREHECVLRHRDPAAESFARVLSAARDRVRGRASVASSRAGAAKDKGKGRRPDSLQRSQTMR